MNDRIQLEPHTKDLGGGFFVRRVLPAIKKPAIGPFVFFDHFGPTVENAGEVHDVRPHPHIGLATVTYLFEGAMMHRDSTGAVQRIEPGAINWMTSGRGIVHSERAPQDVARLQRNIHGLQLWAALPEAHEEAEPSFHHEAAAALPERVLGGATVRVLLGEALGLKSPVPLLSPTLYLDIALQPGARIELPAAAKERGLYAIDEGLTLDGESVPAHTMLLLGETETPLLASTGNARAVLVGGDPLGHRFLWWNFVSSSKQRIQKAADDWAAQAMGQVPGEVEFIPLPERRFV